MTRKGSVYFRSAVVFGVVIVGGFAVFKENILLGVGDFLVVQDHLNPTGVIHVIAGNDSRTEHAIQLYKQGYGEVIFFTGGWCDKHQYYHGQQGLEMALAAGVPEQALAYDDSPVTSTYSEAVRLKEWLDQQRGTTRSVIVVSDPFHMRRARYAYRLVLGNQIDIQMAPTTFDQSKYQRHWWTHNKSIEKVKLEYLKYIYYIARYQLNLGPLREWLVSLDRE
jgi:uncharacterized SAM-binding protein YcdF (DUF218 family)